MAAVGRNALGVDAKDCLRAWYATVTKVAEYSNLGLRDATPLGLPIPHPALWVFEVC
ncbi:MAG: hypothetical protein AABO57_17455 [Acidobacteriota bacterium]